MPAHLRAVDELAHVEEIGVKRENQLLPVDLFLHSAREALQGLDDGHLAVLEEVDERALRLRIPERPVSALSPRAR